MKSVSISIIEWLTQWMVVKEWGSRCEEEVVISSHTILSSTWFMLLKISEWFVFVSATVQLQQCCAHLRLTCCCTICAVGALFLWCRSSNTYSHCPSKFWINKLEHFGAQLSNAVCLSGSNTWRQQWHSHFYTLEPQTERQRRACGPFFSLNTTQQH